MPAVVCFFSAYWNSFRQSHATSLKLISSLAETAKSPSFAWH